MKKLILFFFLFGFTFSSSSLRALLAYRSLAAHLPPLSVLEKSAIQYSGLDPRKIQRWDRNARRAVALPRLQVGFDQDSKIQNTAVIQDSISVTSAGITIGPEANRIDQDFGNNRGFEVKAVWALDELLFNRDELEISQEARDLLVLRGRLIEELSQVYYGLKSQLLRLELEPCSAQDPSEVLRARQLADKLNSLSSGELFRSAPELEDFTLAVFTPLNPKEKTYDCPALLATPPQPPASAARNAGRDSGLQPARAAGIPLSGGTTSLRH